MNNKLLTRLFIVLVIIVVGIFVLDASLYNVGPGEVAVMVNHGEATASTGQPGLHWKAIGAQLVNLDARVHVTRGTFNANSRHPDQGGSAGYAVVWRLEQPETFYGATQGKEDVVGTKLDNAVEGALRKHLAKGQGAAVFSEPADSLSAAVTAALKPVAEKLGITVLAAHITSITPSKAERDKIVQSMLQTDTQARQAKEAEARNEAEKKLEATRDRAHSILAAARQQAASIKGKGEAQVAGIYARASRAAPDFFRFYQTLLSEQAALDTHTRLFILSTDSPWFKVLDEHPGPERKH